jgi:hypothetical protein
MMMTSTHTKNKGQWLARFDSGVTRFLLGALFHTAF